MIDRKNVATVAGDALDGVSAYVDQLAHDEKLRKRLIAAVASGTAARRRAKKQAGLVGLARRLGTDPVLRAQVTEAISQLQKANGRLKKNRSHKGRNIMLLLAGSGIAFVAIRKLRDEGQATESSDSTDFEPQSSSTAVV